MLCYAWLPRIRKRKEQPPPRGGLQTLKRTKQSITSGGIDRNSEQPMAMPFLSLLCFFDRHRDGRHTKCVQPPTRAQRGAGEEWKWKAHACISPFAEGLNVPVFRSLQLPPLRFPFSNVVHPADSFPHTSHFVFFPSSLFHPIFLFGVPRPCLPASQKRRGQGAAYKKDETCIWLSHSLLFSSLSLSISLYTIR